MHTRVHRGVQADGLPSVGTAVEPKVLIFQRFCGGADSSWQYGHLTEVSEHIVHIDGVVGSSPTVTTQKSGSLLRWS